MGRGQPTEIPHWYDISPQFESFLNELADDVAIRIAELIVEISYHPDRGTAYERPIAGGLYYMDFEKTYTLIYRWDIIAKTVYFVTFRDYQ